ncbi:MAG TPA: beta-galactosidase trimerization domain-containing protein [bacterium]|nr:beta-galactosidase trimerization domain-containing protein [bacterium]HNS48677.1 beta-galactosidase trimerization domain-containing protein [bacterium]
MKTTYPDWAHGMRLVTWSISAADLDLITPAEADRRAKRLRREGINAVVSFGAHFRWDWIKDFPRIREVTRISVEACHRQGIKYIEHHSACFVSRIPERTPEAFEWFNRHLPNHTVPEPLALDAVVEYRGKRLNDWYEMNLKAGGPEYWQGYKAYCLCPNHPEYRQAYFDYLEDFLKYTDADGIMSDDVTMGLNPYACVCGECRRLFKSETGYDLPERADDPFWSEFNRPDYRAWLDFRRNSVLRHYEKIDRMIQGWSKPLLHTSCATTISSPVSAETYRRQDVFNTTFVEVLSANPYYYSWMMISPELRIYRARARGGANPSFAIFYPQAKGGEQLFGSAYLRQEEHSVWLSPNIGRHSPQTVGRDSEWALWEEKHDDLFRTAGTLTDLAVFFSDASRRRYRGHHHEHYTYEFKGWCELLHEAGLDYDVVLEEDLAAGRLGQYRTLLAPNAACLSPELSRAIEEYVRSGGRLLASHEASLFNFEGDPLENFQLAECLGLDYERTVFDEHYPIQGWNGDDAFLAGVSGLIAHRAPQVRVRPRPGAEVLLTSFIDAGGRKGEIIPALVSNRFGRGLARYFAGKPGILCYHPGIRARNWDGEEPYRFVNYRDPLLARVFLNAVRLTAGSFRLELPNAKPGVFCRGYRLRDGRLAVHILNAAGSIIPHRTLVQPGYRVKYPALTVDRTPLKLVGRFDRPVRSARLFSIDGAEGLPLKVAAAGNGTEVVIETGELKRHGIVILEPA